MIDLRPVICGKAMWGVENTLAIHYREFRPMWSMGSILNLPWTGDCSTAFREWFFLGGAPDPFKYGYFNLWGNTGTLLVAGEEVAENETGQADAVIYGTDDLSTQHVSLIIEKGPNPMTVSHGREAGPLLQRVYADSRPKRYRRFVTSIAGAPAPTPIVVKKELEMEWIVVSSQKIEGDWYVKGSKRCHLGPAQLLSLTIAGVQRHTMTDAQLSAFAITAWGDI